MEVFRYLGVGLSNTLITVCIYWLLLPHASHRLAYLAAFLVGVGFTAAANSRFTFRSRLTWRGLGWYAVFCVFLYAVNGAVLEVLVTIAGIDKYWAVLFVIAVSVPTGFLGSRFILQR